MATIHHQDNKKQSIGEGIVLLIYCLWLIFYSNTLIQGIAHFYALSDVFAYLMMATIYGFLSFFLLDFSRSWLYLPVGVLNAGLTFVSGYRLTAMVSHGIMALVLNTILLLFPLAVFAVMYIHFQLRHRLPFKKDS